MDHINVAMHSKTDVSNLMWNKTLSPTVMFNVAIVYPIVDYIANTK